MKKLRRTNNNLVEAPFPRRLGASLIDLSVTVVIGLLAFMVNDVIINRTPFGRDADYRIYQLTAASGLYINDVANQKTYAREEPIYQNDNQAYYLSSLEYFYLDAIDPVSNEALFNYESSKFYGEDLAFNYYIMVLDMNKAETHFDFVMEGTTVTSYDFKSGIDNEQKQAIWGELYNEAISVFEDSPLYLEAKTPLSIALLTNAAVSLFIGALAPYLVMPLILGNGQTIGKYMLGLALVNDKGFKIKRWQVVVRYLILGGFEVGASVPLYAIPLFLTSASLTITYGARTFHDFLAKTYVVDAYESQIFDSASEEDTYFNPTKNPKDKAKIYFYKMERRKSNPSKKA